MQKAGVAHFPEFMGNLRSHLSWKHEQTPWRSKPFYVSWDNFLISVNKHKHTTPHVIFDVSLFPFVLLFFCFCFFFVDRFKGVVDTGRLAL